MKNKYKRPKNKRLIQLASKFQPFDYGFNLDIEQEMFKLMYQFFNSSHAITADVKNNARYLKLIIKLIDIIQGRDDAVELNNGIWNETKYVNTKNFKRFYEPHEQNDIEHPVMKDNLRVSKAWYLYNLMRFRYYQHFWD